MLRGRARNSDCNSKHEARDRFSNRAPPPVVRSTRDRRFTLILAERSKRFLNNQGPTMRPRTLNFTDEESFADGVNYGIADCRKRLRSQRSTLRAQYIPPKIEL